MQLAHTLGYAHYEQMLDALTVEQWRELQQFYILEEKLRKDEEARKRGAELRAREVAAAEWFRSKIRAQSRPAKAKQ